MQLKSSCKGTFNLLEARWQGGLGIYSQRIRCVPYAICYFCQSDPTLWIVHRSRICKGRLQRHFLPFEPLHISLFVPFRRPSISFGRFASGGLGARISQFRHVFDQLFDPAISVPVLNIVNMVYGLIAVLCIINECSVAFLV